MIEGIYSNTGINTRTRNNKAKPVSNPVQSYSQYKEFSKAANNASISYGTTLINKTEIPQMSMGSLIKKLKVHGKKEGKDYIIETAKNGNGNIILTINNKSGQPLHVIHYDNGNLNSWNGIENYKYKNGKLSEIISKRGDNKIFIRSAFYDNSKIPQIAFTKEGLTYNTTPEEFIKKLGNQRFEIDEENNLITVFDVGSYKEFRWIDTPEGNIISISNYNNKGDEIKHITLEKNQTKIDSYFV